MSNEQWPMVYGVNVEQAFEALDRLVKLHVQITHPFHNPMASDAALALRELKHVAMELNRRAPTGEHHDN